MSISRRQFLLSTAGASVGAIIPDFYFRALQYFEQFEEPLLEPPARPTGDIFTLSGVRYDDAVTLSLLQQRLNDLGTGMRVVDCGFAV